MNLPVYRVGVWQPIIIEFLILVHMYVVNYREAPYILITLRVT